MPDESWDRGVAPAAAARGFPLWGKVALGCFLAGLLVIGSCAGLLVWGGKSAMQATSGEWSRLATLSEQLASDEGAHAVWGAAPALHGSYPTAEDFVAAARGFRPRLGIVPRDPPVPWSGRMEMNVKWRNGKGTTALGYRFDDGTWLRATWEDGKVTSLAVQ